MILFNRISSSGNSLFSILSVVVLSCLCKGNAFAQDIQLFSACYRGADQTANLQIEVDSTCGAPSKIEMYIIEDNDTSLVSLWPDNQPSTIAQLNSFNNQTFFLVAYNFCGVDSLVSNSAGLDVEAPSPVTIDSVSYQESDIILGWQPVNDTDVVGYVINILTQRNPPIFSEKARVDGRDTGFYRFENEADSLDESVIYVITAIDRCGIESNSTDFHSSLYLDSIENVGCSDEYIFSFEEVVGLAQNVEYQGVFVNDDTNDTLFRDLGSYQPSYTVTGLDRFDEYTFSVVAVAEQLNITQQSNLINFTAGASPFDGTATLSQIRRDDDFYLITSNITGFEPQFVYQIRWEGSAGNSGSATIDASEGIQETLVRPSGSPPFNFNLEVLDECEFRTAFSDTLTAGIPTLESEENGLTVLYTSISGQRFQIYGGYKNSNFSLLADGVDFPFSLPIDNDTLQQSFCIYLQATDEANGEVIFLSDTQCTGLQPIVNIPTAFRPSSGIEMNREFRVYGSFFDPALAEMDIYNRWGERIFKGRGEEQSWNGTLDDGNLAPSGIYFYDLKIIGDDRRRYDYNGTLQLIR